MGGLPRVLQARPADPAVDQVCIEAMHHRNFRDRSLGFDAGRDYLVFEVFRISSTLNGYVLAALLAHNRYPLKNRWVLSVVQEQLTRWVRQTHMSNQPFRSVRIR